MGQPRPLFHLFLSFQTCIQAIFTTSRYVKKCPSSIRYRDSNSRPLEHESPPITTRPVLPPWDQYYIGSFLQLGSPLSILTIVLLFSQHNDKYSTIFDYKRDKHRWRAWDSNPGPKDSRHKRINWAMVVPRLSCHFLPEAQFARLNGSVGMLASTLVGLQFDTQLGQNESKTITM